MPAALDPELARLRDPAAWGTSTHNNPTVTYRGHRVSITRRGYSAGWRVVIDGRPPTGDHPTRAAAVRAAVALLASESLARPI